MKNFLESVYAAAAPGCMILDQYDHNEHELSLSFHREKLDPQKVKFLNMENIVYLHKLTSDAGIRSWSLLESSATRPMHVLEYQEDMITWDELAMCLGESIIRNHPFVDGNKRTALLAMTAFLALNERPIPEDSKETANILIALAERRISYAQANQYFSMLERKNLQAPEEMEPVRFGM